MEARLVVFTFSEGGREEPGFSGGAQLLLIIAKIPIVGI
jgi:hypothetical protein